LSIVALQLSALPASNMKKNLIAVECLQLPFAAGRFVYFSMI
jgi:hypothetical protein